ncbi:PREDICTED: neurogenic protein big brain isoform X2 [Drosophila arizonae]|uniref:Neurogenic protein big brain isoform X1 n=1 Tax=Drosophila arizonae TaxID=7263 RepID=A0ABM1NKZ7_DROAR|nr:PREDICTED: neurogenic protein big brain isoform X1 [Drosophila arizonae]XP_017855633.1 PREDICTED: neurogenic protein big brain isoform X2 [Drosophila arizonae]
MKLQLVALLCSVVVLAQAQNYPPRLSIPGAIPVPAPIPQRQQVLRVRRPGVTLRQQQQQQQHLPAVTQRILLEERPVTEPAEDEQPDAFLPNLLREQQLAQAQQSQFQQAAAAFLSGQQPVETSTPVQQLLQHEDTQPTAILPAPRFSERPAAATPINRPSFNDFGIGRFENSQRFDLSRPTPTATAAPPPPQRVAVIRTRPAAAVRPEPAPVSVQRPRPKPIQPRPLIDQNQLQDEQNAQQQRRQRPVAQTIRKWRDENEDGSITWGYENDDGSFKEELIGTDCITKGTYGYIDPDGNKREYNYETGIKCDPNARNNEEDLQENGFINYEENRAVLPNGLEIDMSQLGKKKSKRPNSIYRN